MVSLKDMGTEQTRKTFGKHGAPKNCYGVKVADMKTIQKKVKIDHQLALDLFKTNNADAQYLAGLIADPKLFAEEEFSDWANSSSWYMVSEYAIAWNLAESPLCIEVCKKWIDSSNVVFQQIAWASIASYLGITLNDELDLDFHQVLISRVENEIHSAANRVRYTMNGYIIALGGAVPELTNLCKEVGDRIGKVEVFMGDTSCKVPMIKTHIEKMEDRNRIGKKKKKAKC